MVTKWPQKWIFDYIWSGLVMTLTFNLLTSNSNQFVYVSRCTNVVNLVKFPQAVYKIWCQQTYSGHTHRQTL